MTSPPTDADIHRADPAYRKRMQFILAATIVVGITTLVLLNFWLKHLDDTVAKVSLEQYQRWLSRLLAGISLIFGAVAAGFGIWVHRLARDTATEGQWPPKSAPTSSDVRIRYLASTDAFLSQLRATAYGLGIIGVGLVCWAVWLLR